MPWSRRPRQTIHLILDLSGSMSIGTPRKADTAGQIAATLATLALLGGHRVFVSTSGGHGSPPLRCVQLDDRAALPGLLRAMEPLEPSGATTWPTDLPRLLDAPRADVLFVLSDALLGEAKPERVFYPIAQASPCPTLVHILAPQDRHPDLRQVAEVADAETGSTMPLRAGLQLARRYTETFDAWQRELHGLCRRERIGYVPWTGDHTLAAWLARDLPRATAELHLGRRGAP